MQRINHLPIPSDVVRDILSHSPDVGVFSVAMLIPPRSTWGDQISRLGGKDLVRAGKDRLFRFRGLGIPA
jgi:hypothetical protein